MPLDPLVAIFTRRGGGASVLRLGVQDGHTYFLRTVRCELDVQHKPTGDFVRDYRLHDLHSPEYGVTQLTLLRPPEIVPTENAQAWLTYLEAALRGDAKMPKKPVLKGTDTSAPRVTEGARMLVRPPKPLGRRGAYDLSQRIVPLVQENPHKEGSRARVRFEYYYRSDTVGDYLRLGGLRADIKYDVSRGYIRVED